ncbi:MAG: dihydropteroate synthase [Calditrichaeota bacterium]|nr:dihydropteroate synthase [Calditrichota bacterium]
MGIVNVTPDSFSDGGLTFDRGEAVEQGLKFADAGADILDIGGESTRPGSEPLGLQEELDRVIPVISALAKQVNIPLSIDTYKAEVARRALDAGASIVNDISAGYFDPQMLETISTGDAGAVLMHIQGTPRDMQRHPHYNDVISEVRQFLVNAVAGCNEKGIARERILVDPGIGFGKTLEHNLSLLRNLDKFQDLGIGVLVGPSRKSFIGLLTERPVGERLEGTLAAVAACALGGVDVVRVHDVAQTIVALKVADAIGRK